MCSHMYNDICLIYTLKIAIRSEILVCWCYVWIVQNFTDGSITFCSNAASLRLYTYQSILKRYACYQYGIFMYHSLSNGFSPCVNHTAFRFLRKFIKPFHIHIFCNLTQYTAFMYYFFCGCPTKI